MKRITSILLMAVISLGSMIVSAAPAKTFSDLPSNHWAYETIMKMVEAGIIDGYEDGTFKPNNNVTRGELWKIAALSDGIPVNTSVGGGHWADPYAKALKDTGYMYTYKDWYLGDDRQPDATVNRQETAMLTTYLHRRASISMAGYDSEVASVLGKFKDFKDMTMTSYIWYVVKNGIMDGYDDGYFHTDWKLTRAELCAIMYRAFEPGSAPLWECYAGTELPTFTSVTGIPLKRNDTIEGSTMYIYACKTSQPIEAYSKALIAAGWDLYKSEDSSLGSIKSVTAYFSYRGKVVSVITASTLGEVWIITNDFQ